LIDVEKSLSILSEAGVRFVIVGGLAVIIRGSSFYSTYDLDFCYARDKENLNRLTRALSPFNPYLRGAPLGLPFHFNEGVGD
jgi:hypothetical protein